MERDMIACDGPTGDPLHGFPLNLDDLKDDLRAFFDMCQHNAKQEAIAKSVQLKAKNKIFFVIESDDEADERLAEIAYAENDVVLCIVDDNNLILPPEEQKRVSAHESRQVQEERAHIEDKLNKLFMLATADREKLDKICQAIESKAQVKELDISNKWKIITGIACEDLLLF
jgi:DNA gyrase/topoisomerase IV subunit A